MSKRPSKAALAEAAGMIAHQAANLRNYIAINRDNLPGLRDERRHSILKAITSQERKAARLTRVAAWLREPAP